MHVLSTGTQRKVWITAALYAGTLVTLLDEQPDALDNHSLRDVVDELETRAKDPARCCIVVSHDALAAAAAQCASLVDLTAPVNRETK